MLCAIERLESDVKARLGEISRPQPAFSDSEILSPADVISIKVECLLPEIGSRLILDAPLELLQGGMESSAEIKMRIMPCGLYGAELILPAGFLRLVSMRMRAWSRSEGHLILPGSAEWECQWSVEEGIAGCPERPRVYFDGGMIRAVGSRSQTDTLASFRCFNIPNPDSEGSFPFPDLLYPSLVSSIASSIGY